MANTKKKIASLLCSTKGNNRTTEFLRKEIYWSLHVAVYKRRKFQSKNQLKTAIYN